MNSLKNVSLEQSWYGPLFRLRILSLIKILTNLFSFLSFFSFVNFFLIFVNLLLTSRKAPVFLFSFSFTLSLRFLPNGAKCFYMPFWDQDFSFHRTPWKGNLSLPWRSSKLTFWVSFLFGGKAPSLPRPVACLFLIWVKTFAPFLAASSTVARARRLANRLPPLPILIVVLAF